MSKMSFVFNDWQPKMDSRLSELKLFWAKVSNHTELLTGTLSGYFFLIFSPSDRLFSNGCSSLYWNFIVYRFYLSEIHPKTCNCRNEQVASDSNWLPFLACFCFDVFLVRLWRMDTITNYAICLYQSILKDCVAYIYVIAYRKERSKLLLHVFILIYRVFFQHHNLTPFPVFL